MMYDDMLTTARPQREDAQLGTNRWSRVAPWVLSVCVLLLIGSSLYWLQWASMRGITLGYPQPHVQLMSPGTTRLLLNQSTAFSASSSGRDLSYFWDFGDHTNAAGSSVSHSYQANGTYTVTVTVADGLNQQSSSSMTVSVFPPPPTAAFTAYVSGYYYQYVTFDASASSADGSTGIQSYQWNFGDGNGDNTSYNQESHNYASSGTYTVTLIVTDGTGQSSQPYSVSVTV